MSEREMRRAAILAQVKSGAWTLVEAAERMEVSYRQAKRLWKRYEKKAAAGLVHGNAGRESNRSKPKKVRKKVVRLIRQKYSGEVGERFGPTLAAEHLSSEDAIELSVTTVRRWMMAEGLWSRARKTRQHRKRRERREHFGELVQLDGSFHEWLEGRGPRGCLMNMVDDATSTTLCRLGEQETIWAAVGVLRAWIDKYGVPGALYTDWKNVYLREPTAKELLHGTLAVTQFGRMCGRLGIRIIAAGSPEAKGRVERNHGTQQDRMVKKMRRKKIATHQAANEYLEQEYCDDHNRRFAIDAASEVDHHLPSPGAKVLREIFRLETVRVLGNDWVVRHDNRFYQVEGTSRSHAPAKSKVTVCEWQDGTMEIHYRGQKLRWHEIEERPGKRAEVESKRRKPFTPPAVHMPNHPWRKSYQGMKGPGAPGRDTVRQISVASASATP
jgi:molybdenum-dependent DNA-binding transcriptional regulator ModE